MVNLKRKDTNDNTQNILLVVTFPVTIQSVTNVGTTTTCSGALQLPEQASTVHTFCQSSTYRQNSRGFSMYDDNLQKMEKEESSNQRRSIEGESESEFTIWPNPMIDHATVGYSVQQAGPVKITITNGVGQTVTTLVNTLDHQVGKFKVSLKTSSYYGGLYFCNIETPTSRHTKKMVVVK
jgi:hypothetical protein